MVKLNRWWQDRPREIFWCEITDREDLGADLKCPQSDNKYKSYWSYSLIKEVLPGDIAFHYSTREKAFIGASVAGAPLEERPIVWTPHSLPTKKIQAETPRPGWWLPIHHFVRMSPSLTLMECRKPENQSWILQWIAQKQNETSSSFVPSISILSG